MYSDSVVITGMGVLACNGIGREAFWKSIEAGKSGIRAVTRFDASDLPCQIAGELQDFNPEDFMKKSVVRNWNRHVHQALASSRLAVEDADLKAAKYDPERIAVAVGTSIGSPDESYDVQMRAMETSGYKGIGKLASSAFSGHSATVHVSIDIGVKGPAITISSGCATGLDALSWGYNQVRMGQVDAAVVGATESPIFPISMAGACALGILSKRNNEPALAMRPFDRHRDGIVLSEGACTLVLERRDKAVARGARILAEVAGNGSSSEGVNPLILDREGRGLAQAIERAMRASGVNKNEIDCIQAHGVSLDMYDRSETNAFKRVFGDQAYRIPISAVKSMIGQSYAAGGLLGLAAGLLALNRDIISPTVNLDDPDPHCDLDFVPKIARMNDVGAALVVAISFGGTHSATIIRKAA